MKIFKRLKYLYRRYICPHDFKLLDNNIHPIAKRNFETGMDYTVKCFRCGSLTRSNIELPKTWLKRWYQLLFYKEN